MPKDFGFSKDDIEAIYAHIGLNGCKDSEEEDPKMEEIEMEAFRKVFPECPNVKKTSKSKKKLKKKTGSGECKMAAKKSGFAASSLIRKLFQFTINVTDKEAEWEKGYQHGLQTGFIYFNGFAINKWIMVYLVSDDLPDTFVDDHFNSLLVAAKKDGIPLGTPSTFCVYSLEVFEFDLTHKCKTKVLQTLTTHVQSDTQMAIIYASDDVNLAGLKADIAPMCSFPIFSMCFNDGIHKTLRDLRSLVKLHKKLPIMGVATKLHDGHLLIACSLNKPRTGAKFDRLSWQSSKLVIFPVKKLHEQIMSIVWEYIQHKALDELVIYRSDVSAIGWPVSYGTEACCIQKALEKARTRLAYVVVNEEVVDSNELSYDKVFDNIGFTNANITRLTSEVSYESEKNGIPAPLAIAQMSITRMADHYDGFKQSQSYEKLAKINPGMDQNTFDAVKKFMKSLVKYETEAVDDHRGVSDCKNDEEDKEEDKEEDEQIRNKLKSKKKSKAGERKVQMKEGLQQMANQVVKVSTKSSVKKGKHQTEPLLKSKQLLSL